MKSRPSKRLKRQARSPNKPVIVDNKPAIVDATAERLAKGDSFEFVDPSRMDSAKHEIGLVRRFRSAHLDRLYRKDQPEKSKFTDRQFAAGDWYRSTHARCNFALSVVASYGERTSASEPSYGLPRTEAQLHARRQWMMARTKFPLGMVGFMDRFLIHDDLPRYGGSNAARRVKEIAEALDRLADWLRLPEPGKNGKGEHQEHA